MAVDWPLVEILVPLFLFVTGLTFIGCGYFRCWLRRGHDWVGTSDGMMYDKWTCRTCGRREWEYSEWWLSVQAKPDDPREPATSPYVETVECSPEWSETGTREIPRVLSGALVTTPIPPRIDGPGHAVLDHEV